MGGAVVLVSLSSCRSACVRVEPLMPRLVAAQGEGGGGSGACSALVAGSRCSLVLLARVAWLASGSDHRRSLVAMAPTGEPKAALKIENQTNCQAHPENWFLTLISYHTVRFTSVYYRVHGNREFYVALSTSKTIVGQGKNSFLICSIV
jgi:hypothetical protein